MAAMAVGAIVGARFGAVISRKMKGPLIVLLVLVLGLRLLYAAFASGVVAQCCDGTA